MEIKITNGVLTVEAVAELTAANSAEFGKDVRTALNGHATLEIDLSRTTCMDCAGLGALIALRKFASARKAVMLLVNPARAVLQLFAAVRAGTMFEIVNTRATDHSGFANEPVFSPLLLPMLLAAQSPTAPRLEAA